VATSFGCYYSVCVAVTSQSETRVVVVVVVVVVAVSSGLLLQLDCTRRHADHPSRCLLLSGRYYNDADADAARPSVSAPTSFTDCRPPGAF